MPPSLDRVLHLSLAVVRPGELDAAGRCAADEVSAARIRDGQQAHGE